MNVNWESSDLKESSSNNYFEESVLKFGENYIVMSVDDMSYRNNEKGNYRWCISFGNCFTTCPMSKGYCNSKEDAKRECINSLKNFYNQLCGYMEDRE